MAARLSIAEALQYGYGILADKERIEPQLLLSHLLQVTRGYLISHLEKPVPKTLFESYKKMCKQLAAGKPIAYLLREKEFWSLTLEVNAHTLIPRPETELLVDILLSELPPEPLTLLELGVGSGAVAIALAKERAQWDIIATDISERALAVARRNVAKFQLANVTLLQSDWYNSIGDRQFNAIVSNPPYIPEGDDHLAALYYEPALALVSGKEGLDAIDVIIKEAHLYLAPGGILLLEHGFDQANRVRDMLAQAAFDRVRSYLDISQIERVTIGYKNDPSDPNGFSK